MVRPQTIVGRLVVTVEFQPLLQSEGRLPSSQAVGKGESAIFRSWSISTNPQCTIAPLGGDILLLSAGRWRQFCSWLARSAAEGDSTYRRSSWSKPVITQRAVVRILQPVGYSRGFRQVKTKTRFSPLSAPVRQRLSHRGYSLSGITRPDRTENFVEKRRHSALCLSANYDQQPVPIFILSGAPTLYSSKTSVRHVGRVA